MLLWGGQAVSELGTRIADIAVPILVLAITHSPAKAGIAGFASGLPYIIVGLYAGAIVDRVDRRRLMIACDLARMAAAASVPIAIAFGGLTYAQIVIAALVIGGGSAFAGPAEFSALRHVVPAQQLPAAISQNEARVYGAQLSGPPLGGFLFGLGRALPFIADAVSYALSLVSLLLIRRPLQGDTAMPRTQLLHDVIEGLRWIWGQPFVRSSTLRAGAGNFVSNGLALIIIVVARDRGASAAAIGFIFTLAATGGLLGAVVAPRVHRRLPPGPVIVGYHAAYAALIPLFLFVQPLAFGVLFGLMLFGAPALNAILGTLSFALVPDRLMGRVEAAASVVTAGASPVSRLSAGLLLGAVGGRRSIEIWLLIAVVVAVGVAVAPTLRQPPHVSLDER